MVTMFSRIVRIPTRSGLESGTACTRVKEFPEVSVFLFSKPKETGMMPGSVCSVTMIAKKKWTLGWTQPGKDSNAGPGHRQKQDAKKSIADTFSVNCGSFGRQFFREPEGFVRRTRWSRRGTHARWTGCRLR